MFTSCQPKLLNELYKEMFTSCQPKLLDETQYQKHSSVEFFILIAVLTVLVTRSIKVISKLPKIPSGTNRQLTFLLYIQPL